MNFFNITWNYIQRHPVVILLTGIALLLIHFFFAYAGAFGNDDLVYAYYAANAGHAVVPACSYCDHFQLRWLPVLISTFFYNLFGVNDTSSCLFSLLCTLLTAFLIYGMIKRERHLIIVLAFVLFVFNHSTVFYANRLLADTGIAAFNFLAYYFYQQQLFGLKKKTTMSAILLSAAMMLAVLSKETVVILLPFWLLLLLSDLYKKRNFQFWLQVMICFAGLLFVYLFYFYVTTGDWLYRYHLLQSDSALGGETYAQYPETDLWKRLGYGLWQVFLLNGDMEYLLFAVAGLLYYRSVYREERKRRLLFAFLLLLLSSNFMSFTLSEYSPLWPDPRHFLFLMPFAVISGAYMIEAYCKDPVKYVGLLICFMVADIFLLFSGIGGTQYVYYGITLILLLRWLLFISGKKEQRILFFYISFAVIMSANFLFDFVVKRYAYYYDQQEVVVHAFKGRLERAVVYTGDRMTTAMGSYLLGFQQAQPVFANVDTCKNFSARPGMKYYLLLNEGYNPEFSHGADSLLHYVDNSKAFVELERQKSAVLYEVRQPEILQALKQYSTSGF